MSHARPPSAGNPAIVAVRTLLDAFFPYRGYAPAPRGLAGGEPRAFGPDEVVDDMKQFFYVRLDATSARPRGRRDWVVVLVLDPEGKYAHHSPDLRRLLEGVGTERAARDGRLDELLVVAPEEFFAKKLLLDVVRELQGDAHGPDPAGARPFYGTYPYHNFALDLPASQSVPPHRVLAPEEAEAFLARERLAHRDLPEIHANDPPVVWLGAREGQVVEITRPSQAAADTALYYRRVKRAPL
jgi:DNA-directed RNA polymerase subunit H (RpoH/RPB5)